jgi:hypothetical protein
MPSSDGLGTHTPIRFGQAIERARGFHLREYELSEPIVNDRYLLYLFHKRVSNHWHGFILLQGARRAGKFTVEMGIALHKRYPIHNARVRPFFGVDGVRERAAALSNQEDQWWEYRNQDDLQNRLREVVERVASSGLNHLYDGYAPLVIKEARRAQDLMNQWEVEEEANGHLPLGAKFAGLLLERRAHGYIRDMMYNPRVRAVLGDLRPRFDDEHWLSALVFVMASLLETQDTNEMSQNIYVPSVVDDESTSLCGRTPFYLYLDPADDFEERVNRFSFFKALNIVESQISKEDRLSLESGVLTRQRYDEV